MQMLMWEDIMSNAGNFSRAKVPGGWLVMSTNEVMTPTAHGRFTPGYEWRNSIAYVPDPDYTWED